MPYGRNDTSVVVLSNRRKKKNWVTQTQVPVVVIVGKYHLFFSLMAVVLGIFYFGPQVNAYFSSCDVSLLVLAMYLCCFLVFKERGQGEMAY